MPQKENEVIVEEETPATQQFKEKPAQKSSGTLISVDQYMAAGVHIGTQRKHADTKKYIFKIRADGLAILDIATIDQRIKTFAKFISKFTPNKIMVMSARDTGKKPVQKFCELTGARAVITRFMPGSLTNPTFSNYIEPDLIFVVDPSADKQAILEALKMNIPIIGLCDTNNMTQNIDLILPVNNKGKKSLGLIFWLLAREVLKYQGKIQLDEDFAYKPEDFESKDVKDETGGVNLGGRGARFAGGFRAGRKEGKRK